MLRVVARLQEAKTELLIGVVLFIVAFPISYRHVNNGGPLWPDASQYANAAAMIHDWLRSGQVLHPYSFAQKNYFQYPGFHLPYHPPVYPGLLGLFFLVTGVGYLPGRLFVTLCFFLSGLFFFRLLKARGLNRLTAFAGSLLLFTTPEIAFWSGDTMSEIPALALVITASYLFLRWLESTQFRYFLVALVFAEAAFLSRYLSAGVLLCWPCWLFLSGPWRKLLTRKVVVAAIVFLVCNTLWIRFTLRFAKYETPLGGVTPNVNYVSMFSLKPLGYDIQQLPRMMGWSLLVMTITAIFYLLYKRLYRRTFFWLSWLVGYLFFVIAIGIFHESRYLIFVLPVFAGLVAELFGQLQSRRFGMVLGLLLVLISVAGNVVTLTRFPRGVVGYDAVGHELANADSPGNVLVAVAEQADLMFRFRSYSPKSERTFIRADRTLVIKPPDYADAKTIKVAHDISDVMDIIRRGRVRYVVTCAPAELSVDDRTEEMIALDRMVRAQTQDFTLVKSFPLLREYSTPGRDWQIYLWKFRGELPETPSELPVLVPTAEMEIQPPS